MSPRQEVKSQENKFIRDDSWAKSWPVTLFFSAKDGSASRVRPAWQNCCLPLDLVNSAKGQHWIFKKFFYFTDVVMIIFISLYRNTSREHRIYVCSVRQREKNNKAEKVQIWSNWWSADSHALASITALTEAGWDQLEGDEIKDRQNLKRKEKCF